MPLLALADFHAQVLKGFIDDLQVGVEQLDVFEGRAARYKVLRGQVDPVVPQKHPRPLVLGFLEKPADLLLELPRCRPADTELQVARALPVALGSVPFIVQLGIDEFENFLEGVNAGVGQNKVFPVQMIFLSVVCSLTKTLCSARSPSVHFSSSRSERVCPARGMSVKARK